MIRFAPAKINLGLQITGKRSDGYHLLESLFVPIALSDILELLPLGEAEASDSLEVLGAIETGRLEDNLVLRAIRALRERYDLPPTRIILKKQIPSGAGMGGGSSDATATLLALRELYALPASDSELEAIALGLGADCPFFVEAQPKLVRGIGEVFSPAPRLELGAYHLVVLKPELHISTAEAFRGLQRIGGHEHSVEEIIQHPIAEWRGELHNDFEDSLFPLYPELARLKARLYDCGAVYASMTGSGAALYGLFERPLTPSEVATLLRGEEQLFFWQGKCCE